MTKFRFEDLKIWQLAISIADELFDIADELERKKLFRFADQLRGSGCQCLITFQKGVALIRKRSLNTF